MKKFISVLAAVTVSAMSVTSAFAGEYDSTVKIEKSGGLFTISSTITASVPTDAVETTSNFVSKEVSGMTPAYDSTKYLVEGPFIKFSLQDMAGKEIEFKKGLSMVFNNVKDTYKNPVVLLNANNTIVELTGSYVPVVKNLTLENLTNINGVIAIADKLVAGSGTTSSTGVTALPVATVAPESTGSLLGSSVEALSGATTGSGINLATATNVQDREKGANIYVLMLVLMLVVSAGGVVIYRKA